ADALVLEIERANEPREAGEEVEIAKGVVDDLARCARLLGKERVGERLCDRDVEPKRERDSGGQEPVSCPRRIANSMREARERIGRWKHQKGDHGDGLEVVDLVERRPLEREEDPGGYAEAGEAFGGGREDRGAYGARLFGDEGDRDR